MARKGTAAQAAEQSPEVNQPLQEPETQPQQVDLPADVEPQAAEGINEPVAADANAVPVIPYVHQDGFRRVTNAEKNNTHVEVDIFIDAPTPTVMGTTKFPAEIWSNLVAAVGR